MEWSKKSSNIQETQEESIVQSDKTLNPDVTKTWDLWKWKKRHWKLVHLEILMIHYYWKSLSIEHIGSNTWIPLYQTYT